jgi:hypothetical protein
LHPFALAVITFLSVDFTCAKVVEKPEFAKSTTPPACQSLKPCSQYCPMALATAKSKLPQKGPSSATGYPFSCKPFYEFSVFSCSKSFDSPPPQKYQFVFVYKLVENRKNVSVHATVWFTCNFKISYAIYPVRILFNIVLRLSVAITA